MILVVGGTGDLGSRIVRRLRDDGHEVRCLVRPQTDAIFTGLSRAPRRDENRLSSWSTLQA